MAKAVWSARATQEFRDLIVYLKQDGPERAAAAAADLKAVSRLLARRPFIGRPGRRDGEREFTVRRWSKVFVYRVTDQGIDISTLRAPRMHDKPDEKDT